MKERILKFILVTATFVAVMGMMLTQNVKSTYADSDKSIKVHYLRDDGNYTNYKICMWDEQNQGTDYDFAVEGKEAVVTYNCSANDVETFNFIIKEQNGATADIIKNRTVDISEVAEGTVDVYIKSGIEEISLEGFDAIKGGSEEETTVAPEETTQGTETSAAATSTSDDSKKDYSVSTGFVILVDVITILIIAVVSYLLCNKKEK